MHKLPVLYSFRRCPYAMRARIALKYAGIKCLLREVALKNKPAEMLKISPKGTVPVLLFSDGKVLEESLDILVWALRQHDTEGWNNVSEAVQSQIDELVENNDTAFVSILHAYKYPNRHPELVFEETVAKSCEYFAKLEQLLTENKFLTTSHPTIADIALFPFIRQYARADEDKFRKLSYPKLIAWLDFFLNHQAYEVAMVKHNPWSEGPGEEF